MEKAIEVKGLRKSFKDTEVLKGVDFDRAGKHYIDLKDNNLVTAECNRNAKLCEAITFGGYSQTVKRL